MRAGEKFGREIADDANILCSVVKYSLDPALDQAVADRVREGHVEVVVSSAVARASLYEK